MSCQRDCDVDGQGANDTDGVKLVADAGDEGGPVQHQKKKIKLTKRWSVSRWAVLRISRLHCAPHLREMTYMRVCLTFAHLILQEGDDMPTDKRDPNYNVDMFAFFTHQCKMEKAAEAGASKAAKAAKAPPAMRLIGNNDYDWTFDGNA